MIKTDNFKDR